MELADEGLRGGRRGNRPKQVHEFPNPKSLQEANLSMPLVTVEVMVTMPRGFLAGCSRQHSHTQPSTPTKLGCRAHRSHRPQSVKTTIHTLFGQLQGNNIQTSRVGVSTSDYQVNEWCRKPPQKPWCYIRRVHMPIFQKAAGSACKLILFGEKKCARQSAFDGSPTCLTRSRPVPC